jgi:hypothetical protein
VRLQYEISATGEQQIRAVLRGVEKEARASNRRMAADASKASAQAARATSGPMFGPGRREQMAAIRANERAMIQSERARLREAITSAKTEQRVRLAQERELSRARDSLDRQRSRALMSRYKSEQRELRQTESARRGAATSMGRGFATTAGGAAGGILRGGGAALGLAGGFAAAGAMREMSEIRRVASELANQAGTPGAKGALAAEAQSIRGLSGVETLSGLSQFVTKTGDLDTGRQIAGSTAQLSLATGANFEDLMATAGQAFNVLKDQISDPVERINQLNSLMGVLAQQGAMGAVEIKDLAQDFGKLGAATRGFQGNAPDLLRTMGAFAQVAVARGGAESSADASTAASRLVGDIVTHKKKFKALGVNIQSKSDPTKLADPMQIIADTLEKTGGDVMKTSGLFGLESGKIFKGFAATFSEAEKTKKGSGRDAVMSEFNRFAGAKLSKDDIDERAASRMDDPDLQNKEAMKEFSRAVGTELLPVATQLTREFVKFIPIIGSAARILGKFVSFLAEHPFSGIGLLIGGAIVKDIATAKIGDMIKGLLTAASKKMLEKTGATLDPDTGELKSGGKMRAVGAGAAVGISIASAILTAGVVNFEKSEAAMANEGQQLNEVRSSTDPEFIRQKVLEQRKRVNALKAPGIVGSIFGEGAQGLVDSAIDQNKGVETKTAEANLAEMEQRLAAAEATKAAAEKLSAAADKLSKANPGGAQPAASRTSPIIDKSRG